MRIRGSLTLEGVPSSRRGEGASDENQRLPHTRGCPSLEEG